MLVLVLFRLILTFQFPRWPVTARIALFDQFGDVAQAMGHVVRGVFALMDLDGNHVPFLIR